MNNELVLIFGAGQECRIPTDTVYQHGLLIDDNRPVVTNMIAKTLVVPVSAIDVARNARDSLYIFSFFIKIILSSWPLGLGR